jgi:hypothetical protein
LYKLVLEYVKETIFTIQQLHTLTQTGHRGVGARARAVTMGSRQLNVAGDVVGGGHIHATHTLRGGSGGHQLHLAEGTTRRQQSLAHVLEHTTRRGDDGRVDGATRVQIGGDQRGRIRVVVLVERGTGIRNGDVVASIGRNLL